MAFPWLRLIDAALGMTDVARRLRAGREAPQTEMTPGTAPGGPLEARLAGVVVAALKEAFDRDSRRLELEREHIEAERARAEQALRLELRRQAGERENRPPATGRRDCRHQLAGDAVLLARAPPRSSPGASGPRHRVGAAPQRPRVRVHRAVRRREPDCRRRRAVERDGRNDCAVVDRRRARGGWRGRARLRMT